MNRSNWNAAPFTIRDQLKQIPVSYIGISQVGVLYSINNKTHCTKIIKAIQDYQMLVYGLYDIQYNLIICSYGNDESQIYEARGWKYKASTCQKYTTYTSNLLSKKAIFICSNDIVYLDILLDR